MFTTILKLYIKVWAIHTAVGRGTNCEAAVQFSGVF